MWKEEEGAIKLNESRLTGIFCRQSFEVSTPASTSSYGHLTAARGGPVADCLVLTTLGANRTSSDQDLFLRFFFGFRARSATSRAFLAQSVKTSDSSYSASGNS